MNAKKSLLTGLLFVLFLLVLLTACQPASQDIACTEIGCTNTLQITLDGAMPERYTVEVESPDVETVSLTCEAGQATEPSIHDCLQDGVLFRDFSPDTATVTVTWEQGIISESFQVDYAIVQPNGPECPPSCRQGTVTISL